MAGPPGHRAESHPKGLVDNRNPNLVGFPAIGRNADGRLEAFVTGADATLWQTFQTAPNNGWFGWMLTWSAWGNGLRPAVASNADGRLEIFTVSGLDYGLHHKWQTTPNGNWDGPVSFEKPPGCEYLGMQAACAERRRAPGSFRRGQRRCAVAAVSEDAQRRLVGLDTARKSAGGEASNLRAGRRPQRRRAPRGLRTG